MGPGSKGRLLLGGVVMAPGSSGGPVSFTGSVSSAPPSREAGPDEEQPRLGSAVDCCAVSASSAPWWPQGEQDGSRERLFVSKLGLEGEAGPVLQGEVPLCSVFRW